MKPYYEKKINEITEKLQSCHGDIKFAVVADSHLDNSLSDTLENISAVDKKVNFDFMLHLGDFLNGNIPKEYTKQILKEQIKLFEASIKGSFYPTQGNHDGYTDFKATDMATDDVWEYATGRKPYYFEDFGSFRIVSVCSFTYEWKEDKFCKLYKILDSQLEWLKEKALDTDKTVIFLSHDYPLTSLKDKETTPVLDVVLEMQKKKGFDIAGWFIGHVHGDYTFKAHGINFFVVASETAYIPQLWGLSENEPEEYPERILNTDTEDLWDAVVLNKAERTISLFRFGAGKDRKVTY